MKTSDGFSFSFSVRQSMRKTFISSSMMMGLNSYDNMDHKSRDRGEHRDLKAKEDLAKENECHSTSK